MKKTLLIVYSNLGLGGIPTKIVDIVNQMKTSHPKTKIYILLKKRRAFDMRSSIINPNVTIVDFNNRGTHNNTILFILWAWLFILLHKPDSILTFISAYSLPVLTTRLLFFWRKTKFIVSEDHYTSSMVQHMAFPQAQRLGIRLLYPLADIIITPTNAVKKDLQTSYGIPAHKIINVPNWSRYAKNSFSNTKRPYDITYVGRIDKTKNILSMLRLFAALVKRYKNHLSCCLVGEGDDLAGCVDYIKSHGLEKNIFIYPPTIDVSQYLRQSKVFVFNPEKKTEGFPISILDAMACGTIVVSKNFYGIREVIHGKNTGFIANTEKEMSKLLFSTLHNYNSLRPVIVFAKKHVAHYNSLNNIRQYTNWFNG